VDVLMIIGAGIMEELVNVLNVQQDFQLQL
jgi:hypothetical protein